MQRQGALSVHPPPGWPPAQEIGALGGEQLEGAVLVGQVLIDGRSSGTLLGEVKLNKRRRKRDDPPLEQENGSSPASSHSQVAIILS